MIKLLIVLLCILVLPIYPSLSETAETHENDMRVDLLEEDVSIGNPALPGTLTLPAEHPFSSYPMAAAVLLHGSGPSNRDEVIGQTALFWDLSQYLAVQGMAVLRYDKRTFVYGSTYTAEDLITLTVEEESIRDAIAAAELLRADPRIDPDRIYLIGHSMGAMIAPRIVQEHPGLFAGIVMLSGTPKTLGEIVLSQNQAIVDSLPALTKAIGQMQMTGLRREWDALLNSTAEEAKTKTVFGQPGYYFWEMAQYDTASILQSLSLPVLIINGGQDFQVIDADGIDAWNALDLPENVRVTYYPELNHLLMNPNAPESARGTVAEYDTPCHLPQEIVWEICWFILN